MQSSTHAFFWLLVSGMIAVATTGAGCAKAPLLKTHTVIFRCDSAFNGGLRLPVDLVYVPEGENVKSITSVAPDSWFDSEVREQWQFKQSLSLVESDERRDVTVRLDKPSRTIALVVYVDYKDHHTTKGQVVVFDASAKETENVFVTATGILHQSP
jgi:hypothetical protein